MGLREVVGPGALGKAPLPQEKQDACCLQAEPGG